MKLLDRYILREMWIPFLIGSVALVLMFQANTLIMFMRTYSTDNVPPLAIFQLLMFKTPEFLKFTLPSAMALSSSLAMSRLTRESELTAIRTAGTSLRRIVLPVVLFSVAIGGLTYWVGEYVQPESEKKFKEIGYKAVILGSMPTYAQNIFFRVGRTQIYFASARRQPNGTTEVSDLMMIEPMKDGQLSLTTAESGTLDKGVWTFKKMFFRIVDGERLVSWSTRKEGTIDQKITVGDLMSSPQKEEMSLKQLDEQIKSDKVAGRDTRVMEIEYFSRFSVPFSCVVFGLGGSVFAIWFGRSGGYVGILLAMLLLWAFLNIHFVATGIFGKNGWISPWVSAWLADIVLFILAFLGLRRLE